MLAYDKWIHKEKIQDPLIEERFYKLDIKSVCFDCGEGVYAIQDDENISFVNILSRRRSMLSSLQEL